MPRPLNIRHDDILGRLDWLEGQVGAKGRSGDDTDALADAYPVQMRAPGVFPEDREQIPASETFAVIDSLRAKAEGDLRHVNPLHPMEAPPLDQLSAGAHAAAAENFQRDRDALEGTGKKASANKIEAAQRAENDAVGNAETGARTGELPAAEVMGMDIHRAADEEEAAARSEAEQGEKDLPKVAPPAATRDTPKADPKDTPKSSKAKE